MKKILSLIMCIPLLTSCLGGDDGTDPIDPNDSSVKITAFTTENAAAMKSFRYVIEYVDGYISNNSKDTVINIENNPAYVLYGKIEIKFSNSDQTQAQNVTITLGNLYRRYSSAESHRLYGTLTFTKQMASDILSYNIVASDFGWSYENSTTRNLSVNGTFKATKHEGYMDIYGSNISGQSYYGNFTQNITMPLKAEKDKAYFAEGTALLTASDIENSTPIQVSFQYTTITVIVGGMTTYYYINY